jgi:hypothetical protein
MKWTARLGFWLARRYPRAWRARYGEEFDALLADRPATLLDCLDVAIGALNAHTMPLTAESLNERLARMLSAVRRSEMIVFAAYIAFVLAGLYLNGLSDDSPYLPLMGFKPGFFPHFDLTSPLAVTWYIIEAFSLLSLAAVLAGGLPIALSIWRRSPHLRRLFFVPVVCFVAATLPPALAIITFYANGMHPLGFLRSVGRPLSVSYEIWFIVLAIISTAAVLRAVARSEIGEGLLRFALWASAAATAAMAIMLCSTLAWGIEAHVEAPGDFDQFAFAGYPTLLTWGIVIIGMLAATVVAASATLRGIDAAHRSGGASGPASAPSMSEVAG